MFKCVALLALLVVGAAANQKWYDPLNLSGGSMNQPILARLSPAMKKNVPNNIQVSLARVTPKDLFGLRTIAERVTKQPTSRAAFLKMMSQQAPNVMFLGTEAFKTGRQNYEQTRKRLSPNAMKFVHAAAQETSHAINEASALFHKQDAATKKNLQAVFPFIPQLIQSSKTSMQYVSKNL